MEADGMNGPIDRVALDRRLGRFQSDLDLIKRGIATLLEKLPERPFDELTEPRDIDDRFVYVRRRPPGVDDLNWTMIQMLDATDRAVRDIEAAKCMLDSLFRRGIEL